MSQTKILVIEDEAVVLDNVKQILEASGYQVITANNGRTGIDAAVQTLPELIICDIMMPEVDGYGVLQALRQSPATAQIPMIFLTAKADQRDLRQGMSLGADDYLTKPFDIQDLLQAVQARLARQAAFKQRLQAEMARAGSLQKQADEYQQQIHQTQKLDGLREETLNRAVENLRNPMANIHMAIQMLKQASTQEQRDRYIQVLQNECAREIELLNEFSELRTLLSPENAKLLQRYQLINSP